MPAEEAASKAVIFFKDPAAAMALAAEVVSVVVCCRFVLNPVKLLFGEYFLRVLVKSKVWPCHVFRVTGGSLRCSGG